MRINFLPLKRNSLLFEPFKHENLLQLGYNDMSLLQRSNFSQCLGLPDFNVVSLKWPLLYFDLVQQLLMDDLSDPLLSLQMHSALDGLERLDLFFCKLRKDELLHRN